MPTLRELYKIAPHVWADTVTRLAHTLGFAMDKPRCTTMPSLKAWWTDILLLAHHGLKTTKELNHHSVRDEYKGPPLHFDREGFPIGLGTWSRLFENYYYKVVKQTQLPNSYWVSTVWLGLDHSFGGPTPLIFETMVQDRKTGDWMDDQERYSDLA